MYQVVTIDLVDGMLRVNTRYTRSLVEGREFVLTLIKENKFEDEWEAFIVDLANTQDGIPQEVVHLHNLMVESELMESVYLSEEPAPKSMPTEVKDAYDLMSRSAYQYLAMYSGEPNPAMLAQRSVLVQRTPLEEHTEWMLSSNFVDCLGTLFYKDGVWSYAFMGGKPIQLDEGFEEAKRIANSWFKCVPPSWDEEDEGEE